MSDEIEQVKGAVGVVGELIKGAADTPEAKEAAKNLGRSAVTVTKTLNNLLLPLAAVNAAFDKAREYFNGGFQRDLLDRTKDIPIDDLTEPKVTVAGPALQSIAFSCEEPTLRDMFVQLIATSMDRKLASLAHPAFVEIIRQLEPFEASCLSRLLPSMSVPIVQLRSIMADGTGFTIERHHLLNGRDAHKDPYEIEGESAMVQNWIRLGLVDVTYESHLSRPDAYDWVSGRPEYQRLQAQLSGTDRTAGFEPGILRTSDFGKRFADAVGLTLPAR